MTKYYRGDSDGNLTEMTQDEFLAQFEDKEPSWYIPRCPICMAILSMVPRYTWDGPECWAECPVCSWGEHLF